MVFTFTYQQWYLLSLSFKKIDNTQCTEAGKTKHRHISVKHIIVNRHNLLEGNLVNSIKTENVYAIQLRYSTYRNQFC